MTDREDKEQTTECVYKVPRASCEKTYIGETGRKLGVRLQEHRSKVESKTNRAFTRSHRSSSSAESNRSEGRSKIHEPGRRELPTQSYVRPLSWLDSNLSRQEPEEEDLVPASSDEAGL